MAAVTPETANRTARDFFEKAQVAIERKNFDYATEMLIQCLGAEPNFLKARQVLRAVQMKNASANPFKRLVSTARSAPALTKAKMVLHKDPIEAMSLCEQALTGDPRNPQALLMLAEAATTAAFPETTIQTLEFYVQHNPRDARALHLLARVYRECRQFEQAHDIYDKLLEINPNDFEAQKALKDSTADGAMHGGGWNAATSYRDVIKDKQEATALEQESRVVRAEDMVENLIKENLAKLAQQPNSPVLRRELGKLYAQKNDFETALRYLDGILQSEGSDASLEREIASIKSKQLETQLADKKRLLDQKPANLADLQREVNVLEKELNAAGIAEARRLVERYPNDLMYRYELGVLLMKSGHFQDAVEPLQRAVSQPQKRIASLNYLGQCFIELGLHDIAVEQFTKAIEELPGMDNLKKDLIYNLGRAYESMGEHDKAITEFKKIAAVDFGFRDVRDRIMRKAAPHT